MIIICIPVRSSVLANFRSYVFSRGGGGSDGSSSPAAWSLADAEFIRFVDGVLSGSDSRNKVKISYFLQSTKRLGDELDL